MYKKIKLIVMVSMHEINAFKTFYLLPSL